MYRPTLRRQALRLGLLATLVVLALNACGGGQEQADKPRPLPEDPKALRPGAYRSEEFEPSLSFRVGKGWSGAPLEASDVLRIRWGQTAGLSFLNIQEAYKPVRTATPNVVDAPKDMVGWLQQHPYLQTSKPEPVTVGGVKGVQFEVVLGERPQYYIPTCTSIIGNPNCVDLFRLSTGGKIFVVEGEKISVTVLEEVKGETVMMGFGSPTSEFEEFAPEGQKVVDSVKWGGSKKHTGAIHRRAWNGNSREFGCGILRRFA
jgi:hypothetical protein